MGAYHRHKHKTTYPKGGSHGCFVPKPVCAWLAFGFLCLAFLHICCSPSSNQKLMFSPLQYSLVSSEYVNVTDLFKSI
jgi:xyloglucan O-acetyltransferase